MSPDSRGLTECLRERGLNLSCERRRVENDESFDFTALRITRLLVTTRNEISREEEERIEEKKGFSLCYVFFPIRYFDFLHLVSHARYHNGKYVETEFYGYTLLVVSSFAFLSLSQ